MELGLQKGVRRGLTHDNTGCRAAGALLLPKVKLEGDRNCGIVACGGVWRGFAWRGFTEVSVAAETSGGLRQSPRASSPAFRALR